MRRLVSIAVLPLRLSVLMRFALVAVVACAHAVPELPLERPPVILTPLSQVGVEDGRGRFREILLAVRAAREGVDPADPDAERIVHRMGGEPAPTGAAVHMGPSRIRLRVLVVPGYLGDAMAQWVTPFEDALPAVRRAGIPADVITVSGRGSCEYNATRIKKYFEGLALDPDERVVVIGYSKGAPDILEAVVRYPVVRERVHAILAVAGAVGGSPVADKTSSFTRGLVALLPILDGSAGDGRGIESLSEESRQLWLSRNVLPDSIRYYSLGSFTSRDRISAILRSAYDDLAEVDPRNDGQLIFYDQVIPRGTLLGFANADHWGIALPINTQMAIASALAATQNEFPRHLVLEAALRFIEERLYAAG